MAVFLACSALLLGVALSCLVVHPTRGTRRPATRSRPKRRRRSTKTPAKLRRPRVQPSTPPPDTAEHVTADTADDMAEDPTLLPLPEEPDTYPSLDKDSPEVQAIVQRAMALVRRAQFRRVK